MSDGANITRRALVLGSASAAMAACGDAQATPSRADGQRPACGPPGAVHLGPLSAFPQGAWRAVRGVPVIVGRDARGVFAFSAECTHHGCDLPAPTSASSGITCPCHGARFDGDGAVTSPPASFSLDNYRVVVCDGAVFVHLDAVVPIGTRAAV